MALDILNVIELPSQGIPNVDDNDFPISLTLVKQCHDTQNLDLFHLANIADELANLADIEWVIVALSLCFRMSRGRILPCLPIVPKKIRNQS